MRIFLFKMLLWLQPEATGAEAAQQVGERGGGQAPGCGGGGMQLGMLAVMFFMFYFLLIRPQQKRQREHDSMLKSLQKGDKVRTRGGIRGEVVEIGEQEATLQIADRVKINILRSHIEARAAKPRAGTEPDAKQPAPSKKS